MQQWWCVLYFGVVVVVTMMMRWGKTFFYFLFFFDFLNAKVSHRIAQYLGYCEGTQLQCMLRAVEREP